MVIAQEAAFGDLVEHLVRVAPLTPEQAERVVAEVVAALGETVEEFVQRRHRELQRAGLVNTEIFARLGDELRTRRFAAPGLSQRQLRRLVYG
jgi:ribulose kinase